LWQFLTNVQKVWQIFLKKAHKAYMVQSDSTGKGHMDILHFQNWKVKLVTDESPRKGNDCFGAEQLSGFGQNHPEVRKTDAEEQRLSGLASPMGARMMSGNSNQHEQLEKELSEFVGKGDTAC